MKVGVVIGRFHIDELHSGHKFIINQALTENDSVICFVGVSVLKADKNQPLDFLTRVDMIHEAFPTLRIYSLPDMKQDTDWSFNLDWNIKKLSNINDTVTLYSGRDGFSQFYTGTFSIREVVGLYNTSGVEIRKRIGDFNLKTKDFRTGVIYSTQNKYDIAYPVIDCAIYNDNNQVLLIHKNSDGSGVWRFMGGFFDVTQDKTLEMAVRREAKEECGDIEIGDIKYLSSQIIDDWRYKRSSDKVLTSFFKAKYVYGQVKAGDDADDIAWHDINSNINIVEGHGPLL